ncbi:MAG TPA: FKBP-type peptidyl-prolyl cis-trans isomerase [Candidatus Acidoferrum sp.]|nr:FKBP-type peptidyl-prolyl cis-trans isomerase [Candidatus Acidoferrum sp.]
MATKKSERIIIAIIALVMTFGTLGTYLVIIWQGNNAQTPQAAPTNDQSSQLPIDPTAYKVSGPVTGLQVQDLKVGTGAAVAAGDTVRVHYKGTIAQTGAKFDSSYDRGEPLTISLGQVIPGWQQGMIGMQVGGKRRIIIPSVLGYGAQGQGTIPPNADLVFEVELLAINPPK